MELKLLNLPSLLLPLCFLLLFTLFKRSRSSNLNLPPRPWKLPLIGSIHYVFNTLPHHAFHRLAQRHGQIMLVQLGLVDTLVISSPELAAEIMKIQDINFSSRPEIYVPKNLIYGCRDILFSPYGDYWRQIKKIAIVELLSTSRVRSYHSIFEDEISDFVMNIRKLSSENKSVNLSGMLLTLMNSIIGRCAVGDKGNLGKQERFILALEEILELMSGFSVVDLFPSIKYLDVLVGVKSRVQRLHQHVDEILQGIIKEHELKQARRTSPRGEEAEDLLDVLLRIRRQGELEIPLTDDNLKAVILDMFLAGTDTTSTLIAWVMSQLIKNPLVIEKAKEEVRRILKGKTNIKKRDLEELSYLKYVTKETLRLHPPVPLLGLKMCIDSCKVAGYDIPAGTRVVINAWAIGRDPRYWKDAEQFKPERFVDNPIDFKGKNFEFLPFGAGRRMCPGISFANAVVEFTLAQLLLHFDWKLPNRMTHEELDMTESFGITSPRKFDLYLVATPYFPPCYQKVMGIGNDYVMESRSPLLVLQFQLHISHQLSKSDGNRK
uniref:Premnaspirodiene oxygenase n=1 Tax=Fritillaria cirrhosa TaxID=108544 RepID=A0A1L7H7Y6_9LILI|nr:premnaspirodiene oxygenase [Fritillaria cirrhosa]